MSSHAASLNEDFSRLRAVIEADPQDLHSLGLSLPQDSLPAFYARALEAYYVGRCDVLEELSGLAHERRLPQELRYLLELRKVVRQGPLLASTQIAMTRPESSSAL